jgi:hypothetical protein
MNASSVTQPRSHSRTNSTLVVVGLIAPLVFFTCCLILSRYLSERFAGYVAIVTYIIAIFGGATLVWRGIGQRPLRWFACLSYVILGATFLFFYTFAFVCLVFHDCL